MGIYHQNAWYVGMFQVIQCLATLGMTYYVYDELTSWIMDPSRTLTPMDKQLDKIALIVGTGIPLLFGFMFVYFIHDYLMVMIMRQKESSIKGREFPG